MKFIYDFGVYKGGSQVSVSAFYHSNLLLARIKENGAYDATIELTIITPDGEIHKFVYYKPFRWYNSDGRKKCRNTVYKMSSSILKDLCNEKF